MKITCLDIYSDDHNPGVPKWRYSLAFAFLQAYLTKSEHYEDLEFCHLRYYQSVDPARVEQDIIDSEPDVLAVSCYVWNIDTVLEVLPGFRKKLPNARTVLGGPEFMPGSQTWSMARMEEHPAIDVIVVGEGEITFLELIEAFIADAGPEQLSEIRGLIHRGADGAPVLNPPRPIIKDLNDIPSPYLSGIVDLSRLEGQLVAIETQRGCPFDCSYCNYQKGNRTTRFFDVDRVLAELDLILQHRPKHLYLMDPTFNTRRQRAKDILVEIAKMKERYGVETTVGSEMFPENLDEELLALCKKAGMNFLELGIQSLTPEALKFMGRHRNEEKLFQNLDFSLEAGLTISPQIIYGLPGDDLASFFRTFDRIYSLPSHDLQIFHLGILPGTRYARQAEQFQIVHQKEAPYLVIETPGFRREEMTLLDLMRNVVLITIEMRPEIYQAAAASGQSFHQFFLDFIQNGSAELGPNSDVPGLPDFSWPPRTDDDVDVGREVIDAFVDFLLEALGDAVDDELKSTLSEKRTKASRMLNASMLMTELGEGVVPN
jgi:anaerobic magnesium-protoporphyrin IX monomethyl ester cyclase